MKGAIIMKVKIVAGLMSLLMAGGTLTGFASQQTTPPVSPNVSTLAEATLQQDGEITKASYDGGNTWEVFSAAESPDSYDYEEYAAWIKEEIKGLQELVAAGEITQEEADTVIQSYYDTLEKIKNGLQVSKRSSYNDEQLFFSNPNAMHTEGYQTAVFDGHKYQYFGPYETRAELYEVLKQYTDSQVASGNMTSADAEELLEKYK